MAEELRFAPTWRYRIRMIRWDGRCMWITRVLFGKQEPYAVYNREVAEKELRKWRSRGEPLGNRYVLVQDIVEILL